MTTTDKNAWKPLVMRKSKARHIERIFITNGKSRSGYYADLAEAEAECAKLNNRDEVAK